MAALLHGPEIDREDARLRTISGMDDVAAGMKVKLAKGEGVVGRLVEVRG